MIIHQAILHLLDKESGNLVFSQKDLPLSQEPLLGYLVTLMDKLVEADSIHGQLEADHVLLAFLSDPDLSFIDRTQALSQKLFDLIGPLTEIPAADYLFIKGLNDMGHSFFSILRLDYQTHFTHFVDHEDDLSLNTIIQHRAILPNPQQRPSQAFVLDLETGAYQLLEKVTTINGEKRAYFSQDFLEIEPPKSTSDHLKTLKKTVQKVAKKYNEESYQAMAAAQQVLYQSLEDRQDIEPAALLDQVFQDQPLAQEAAKDLLQEMDLPEKLSLPKTEKFEKKYSKQKFRLDNGIELIIPSHVYQNKDMVEFINNPDGTVSVLIKGIDQIKNQSL